MLSFKWEPDKIVKVVLLLLSLFGILYLALYLKYSATVIASPYQYDYGEGFHWYIADQLSQGHNVYHSLQNPPYVTMVYTPLYYLVTALGIKIVGSALWIGRLLSVLCTLGTCLFAYKIVKLKTTRTVPALLAGVLPLTVGFYGYWSTLFRVDALALFLSVAGLYTVVRSLGSWKVQLSIPLFLLAIFTKQSYVAAPVAVAVYLFVKDRPRSLWFVGLLGLGGALLVGLCTLVFGSSFVEQTFLVGSQPHTLKLGANLLRIVLYSIPVVLMFSVTWVLLKIKHREWDLFAIYFTLALAMCLVLIFKQGAWLNYAQELVVISSILVGLLLGHLLNKGSLTFKKQFIFVGILLILPLSPMGSWYNYEPPTGVQTSYEVLRPILENVDDPVICEDATLAMEAGRTLVWEPSVFVLGGYYKASWNQSPFVESLASKSYSVIVLNYDVTTWWLPQDPLPYPKPYERLTKEMATAIVDNYYLAWNSSSYWLYLPDR